MFIIAIASIAGMLELIFALTTVISAPTLFWWKVSIAAIEFGHLFAIGALAFGLLAWFSPVLGTSRKVKFWIAAPFFLSFLLLLSPAQQSALIGRQLAGSLVQAFGEHAASPETRGFSWREAYFPSRPSSAAPPEKVSFSRPDGSPGIFYFFRSNQHAPSPLVIVVHGGAWNSGDPLQLSDLNVVMAQHGYAVASVDYRFMPDAPGLPGFLWPTQKNDVLAAIQSIRERAALFGVDPSRIVILGRSAGGQIAETVAFDPPESLRPAIRGCIAFYSPADMNFAYRFGREDDILNSLLLLRTLFGGTPEQVPQQYHSASGYDFVGPTTPPTLLIHGDHDELVWPKQSERLLAKMHAAHRPVMLLDLPWATHGFDFNLHGPGGQLSTQAVLAFLQAVTSSK